MTGGRANARECAVAARCARPRARSTCARMLVVVVVIVVVAARGALGAWIGREAPIAARAPGAAPEAPDADARVSRELPVGPCPLPPLAICEKLNYVVIEEEIRSKDAAQSCAKLRTGRRFVCAFGRSALATLSRATNWGDVAFKREVRVVPLLGNARRASRQPSYDHALASLCDLRMNKLCGDVVEQRVEYASKLAEQKAECEAARVLGDQWEVDKAVCEAKAAEIKNEKAAMEAELRALEESYAKKFGEDAGKKMSKGRKSASCRSREFGDKPDNDDIIIAALREIRAKLLLTKASGGYCNKEAVDSIVNSKTAPARAAALKKLTESGDYFEHCDGVLKHLDFMIDLLDLQRKSKFESQGKLYQPWCDELELSSGSKSSTKSSSKEMKSAAAEAAARRKEMLTLSRAISHKRESYEKKQLEMMQKLREQCTTRLNDAHRLHLQALVKCEQHGPRLRILREDIINVESMVERVVPSLDQVITATAIVGATPEAAAQLASAVSFAELAEINPSKDMKELERMLGVEPLRTLRNMCAQSVMLGAGGGTKRDTPACPDFQLPGPISCAQACAAMEEASIGRVSRRDKPFSLGIIAGIAIGYVLFGKLRVQGGSTDADNKAKKE